MKLNELFDKGEFVITGEVGPVKGAILRDKNYMPPCAKEAEDLRGYVNAINVTDNQSAVMRLGSLAACVRLKKKRPGANLSDHLQGQEQACTPVRNSYCIFTRCRQYAYADRGPYQSRRSQGSQTRI